MLPTIPSELAKQFMTGTLVVSIPPQVLWGIFGVAFVLTAVISAILIYHWSAYGYRALRTGFMAALYFTGVIILLSGVFLGISSYLLSI